MILTLKQALCICFVALCAFSACTKSANTTTPVKIKPDTDVYISGAINDATDTNNVATYWKNGVATSLTSSSYSYTSAIATDATDIYIAGTISAYHSSSKSKAVYWKNGVVTYLTDGTTNAIATDITVVGPDVYVAGAIDAAAVYWKNGVVTTLSDNTEVGTGRGIAVSGPDVYVCGNIFKNSTLTPVFWKNGVMTQLINAPSTYSVTISLAVQNNNVYATYYNLSTASGTPGAYVWENGVSNPLSGTLISTITNRILINGNNVYVTGYTIPSTATPTSQSNVNYWKNNIIQTLSTSVGFSYTSGVAVLGNDVYFAGYANNQTVYWKNGVAVKLGNAYSAANGIVAIPH